MCNNMAKTAHSEIEEVLCATTWLKLPIVKLKRSYVQRHG
jgi:hypothetical protein